MESRLVVLLIPLVLLIPMQYTIHMTSLRILSLNTFGAPILSRNISKRFRLIADILSEQDADIICLQEVVLYPHLRLLKSLLTGFPYVHYKKFLYGPKGGIVIFSKYPVAEQIFYDFTDRGSIRNKSFVGQIMRYGVLGIRLQEVPITVFTTHLTPNMDVDYTHENRYSRFQSSQLFQVAKYLHDEILWKREVIIAGDFNIPADSYLYQDFIQASGLTNIFSHMKDPTYHEAFLPDGKLAHQIDYIFYSGHNYGVKPLHSEYILEHPLRQNGEEFYLSDHIGLKAQLSIPHAQTKNTN
jgi:sphingomyelin phosphodiesterase 2